jgi:uncharacterized protein
MVDAFPVLIPNGDIPLVGRVFRNTRDLAARQPVVVVAGSWLTVKEQMPRLYAERLAALGYTALTFDFVGFGDTGGALPQTEIPLQKARDLAAVAAFAATLSFATPGAVGSLCVCASAQYALLAAAQGAPLRSLVSVAGWFHDAESIAPFYGGSDGVSRLLERSRQATAAWLASRAVEMTPAYREGDPAAAMSFPLDYYARADRGAVPEWRNEMSVMSWQYWLTFDGIRSAASVTVPCLFVHSDGCALPDNLRRVHEAVRGDKTLVWGDGGQTDYYDQPAQVERAVQAAHRHFAATL